MSSWIWYVIMGAGLIAMVWCAKNQKRLANAQIYAGGCLIVVAISAIMALYQYFGDGDLNRMINNSKQFELAKVDQLAAFISQKYAGKKAVLLVKSDMLQEGAEGVSINRIQELKKRLKGVELLEDVKIEITDPSKIENPEEHAMYMPEEELSLKVFNKKFDECKKLKPDLIINLAGLPFNPEDVKRLKIWKWGASDPKVIFYEANAIGDTFIPDDLKHALAAAVLSKNDTKYPNGKPFDFANDTAPKDLKEAFDLRYVIVTVDNIEEVFNKNEVSIIQQGN